jgi:transcription initiation factor TFIIB
MEILACSTCNTDKTVITDAESGEIICSNCGIIISDRLEDYTHEDRRAFSMEEVDNRSRTGAPTSLAIHDRGLSTTIDKVNKDVYGKMLDAAALPQIRKLRRWNSMINLHRSSEKSLNRAFKKLEVLKERLGLSDATVEKIAYIFRKVHDRDLVRGRTIDGMLSAAVYTVCREIGSSITLKDIAAASNLTQKDVSRNYKVILYELDIKIPLVDPMKCIAKVANVLGINEKTKKQAMNIMKEVVKREMTPGKIPMGLAASAVYLSCQMAGKDVSQASIAAASGVTEVTIRKRLKDLVQLNC